MRLFRSILTLALVGGGVFATAARSEAAFFISINGATGGSGFASSSTIGQAIGATDGGLTVGTSAQAFSGGVLDLSTIAFTATAPTAAMTVVIRSNDITYLSGIGTFTTTGPSVPPTLPVGTSFSAAANTGNSTGLLTGTTLATVPGLSGTTTFATGAAGPRFIEFVYNVSFTAAGSFTLLDVPIIPGSPPVPNEGDVSVATPAPMTLVAALGCLPVLGFVGFLRRRNVKPVETA
jgi:hypothetical protein